MAASSRRGAGPAASSSAGLTRTASTSRGSRRGPRRERPSSSQITMIGRGKAKSSMQVGVPPRLVWRGGAPSMSGRQESVTSLMIIGFFGALEPPSPVMSASLMITPPSATLSMMLHALGDRAEHGVSRVDLGVLVRQRDGELAAVRRWPRRPAAPWNTTPRAYGTIRRGLVVEDVARPALAVGGVLAVGLGLRVAALQQAQPRRLRASPGGGTWCCRRSSSWPGRPSSSPSRGTAGSDVDHDVTVVGGDRHRLQLHVGLARRHAHVLGGLPWCPACTCRSPGRSYRRWAPGWPIQRARALVLSGGRATGGCGVVLSAAADQRRSRR